MNPRYELVIQHRNGAKSRAYFLAASGLLQKPLELKGLKKFTSITLKRGYTSDQRIFRWHQANSKKKAQVTNASIYLLDPSGKRSSYWVMNAFPSKYTPAPLDAKANDIAIAELELEGEGIDFRDS